MTATSCLRAIQPEYIDVDVYVPDGEGEWNFSIFKDVETGRICFGDYLWAEDKDACFEETDKDPNIGVWIQVIEEMPRVLKFISDAEEAKNNFIRTYNPEMDEDGDIKLVAYKTASDYPPENVWSEWEGEGKRYLVPGFRVVNATGRYAVTDKAWGENEYIEVQL